MSVCVGVTVAEVWACLLTSDLSLPDDSGDEEPAAQSDRSEIQGTLKILVSKLDDLSTCNDLIAKHGAALQRSLSELEGLKIPLEGGEKIKAVNERATLFRITSNAMINVSAARADAPNVVKVTNTGMCCWQKPIYSSSHHHYTGFDYQRAFQKCPTVWLRSTQLTVK